MKTYLYKVYDSSGNYIKTWSDVASEFELSEEINTAGSEISVVLARSTDALGEDSDIVLDNRVKIYVVDDDTSAQNGLLVFDGYILDYAPTYGAQEQLKVTLSSFGLDLGEHMFDLGNAVTQNDSTFPYGQYFSDGTPQDSSYIAQKFTPASNMYAQSITLWVNNLSGTSPFTMWVNLHSGSPSGADPTLTTPLATSSTISIPATGEWRETTFYFSTPILLTGGSTYYFEPQHTRVNPEIYVSILQARNVAGSTSGGLYSCSHSGGANTYTQTAQTNYSTTYPYPLLSYYYQCDLRYSVNGGTEMKSLSIDPSTMLKRALDIYASQGGRISYSASSIDDTGYTTSYTFNGMTMLEVVKKCLELAPPDWYFYVDPGTNLLHFHKRTTTYDHQLILGKNVESITPTKTQRSVVNTVYFVGGDGFYKKYVRGTARQRAQRYVDQRVTKEATADIIANTILEANNAPEVKVSATLIDNSGSALYGYDLESITIGQNVSFRNIGTTSTSIWDVAFWDQSYWDFNMAEMESLILQINRIERRPGSATISLTSLSQDVNKRIEDINRRLVQDQTAAVAVAPETS